jgi:hypothetical protein
MTVKTYSRFLLRGLLLAKGYQILCCTAAFTYVGCAGTMAGLTSLISDGRILDCLFPMGRFAHRLGLFHMTFLADTGSRIRAIFFFGGAKSEEDRERKYQHYRKYYNLSFHYCSSIQGYPLYLLTFVLFRRVGLA